MTGSLDVVAVRSGARTVVAALRQSGLARSSRPLRDSGDPQTARLVVSQLGPGFVRGDRFETTGEIGPEASLILAAQAATRVLGRGDPSTFAGRYHVAENGRLLLAGEPTIAYAGASHRNVVHVALEANAAFACIDAFAPHETFDRIATSLHVTIAGRPAVHDALVLTPDRLRYALGTAFYLRAGMTHAQTGALVAAADGEAFRANAGGAMRIGVGSPAAGGVALRATGTYVHDVRAKLAHIVDLVRTLDLAAQTRTSDDAASRLRRTFAARFEAGRRNGR